MVPSQAAVREIIGLGLPEALASLFPNLSLRQREQVQASYSTSYVALDQKPSPLFAGALETLTELRRRGHLLAVATGKSRRGLNRVLTGLDLHAWFDITRCADETRSKPHPLMLEEILQELAGSAADALLIGDSEYDLRMAQAIQMPAIGVSYGVHSAERLRQHGAELIIDQLTELLDLRRLG